MAATKVKGLLKGIKSISNIFDEKEPEMQIGLPTDVKHIAHIGSDGPSANTPSWMGDFKSSEQSSGLLNSSATTEGRPVSKPRQQSPMESPITSPTKKNSGGSKHGRRHRNRNTDSQGGEGNPRRTRRHHRRTNSGGESSSSDVSAILKQSRRRKHKGSSGGASEISSQDQLNSFSFTDTGSISSERVSESKYH